MDSTKARLLQVFKNQSIKITDVVKKISASDKYFNAKGAINSEFLEKISVAFPEINMDWVVSNRGEMLINQLPKTTHMNNYNFKNLWENLEYIRRKKLDVSVKTFIEPLGITFEDYRKIENGSFELSKFIIDELCRIFELDEKDILEKNLTDEKQYTHLKNINLELFIKKTGPLKEIKSNS